MYKELTWRDDDINWLTDLKQFAKIHDFFDRYNVKHTIALIAKDIHKNQELIDYIKSKENIDVQLHCWNHISFPHNLDILKDELKLSIDAIEKHFGKKPVTVFPPWNRTNEQVEQICGNLGLNVSVLKSGISNYVKNVGNIDERIINFHYWNDGDTMFLERALQLYHERKTMCIQ